MSTACDDALMLTGAPRAVRTTAATDDTLATQHSHCRAWQNIIDEKLIEWGRDPKRLEEPELIEPSRAAIDRAIRIALRLRDEDAPPPTRVVPDGDGGIVLERWNDRLTVSIEIDREGRIEIVRCRDRQVIDRSCY